jgi:hypothetical protein
MNYQSFLEAKIPRAKETGFDVPDEWINPMLFPHQRDIVKWAVKGGSRAIFAAFGLGKTFMQLEICWLARWCRLPEGCREGLVNSNIV